MELLEEIAETFKAKRIHPNNEKGYFSAKKSQAQYEGLAFLEESAFTGPTSIKYWM